MAVALLALGFSMTGTALAVNPSLILDQGNTATGPTTVTAASTWPTTGSQRLLQLTNTNTTAGATALGLTVATGHPPFTVNSGTKVTNLNADKFDGLDSTQLQRRITGSCSDGWTVRSIDSSGGLVCSGLRTAADVTTNGSFPKATHLGSFSTNGGPLLVDFAVTGYNASPDRLLHAQLDACPTTPCALNTPGLVFLANADVYTNEADSHKLMASSIGLRALLPGTWYLNVFPASDTITDNVDLAKVAIIEFGS
jgi:hypothetical protein